MSHVSVTLYRPSGMWTISRSALITTRGLLWHPASARRARIEPAMKNAVQALSLERLCERNGILLSDGPSNVRDIVGVVILQLLAPARRRRRVAMIETRPDQRDDGQE